MPVFTIGTLVTLAISIALSVAMRVISSLLAPHNNGSSPIGGQLARATDPGTQVTVRNPDQPHQVVFGRRRVQGNIVFAHTTANNAALHLVVVWAGHEVDGYEDLYFNDELLPVSGHAPTGKYAGYVAVYDHLGTDAQEADADLIAQAPDKWTVEHRGRGIAYSYIRLGWNRDLFPTGLPNIWRVVRGLKTYDPRTDTTAWSANAALAVAAWMNSDRFGRAVPYDGANGIDLDALSAAANVCDEDVPLAAGGTEKRYTSNGVLQSDQPFVDNLVKLLSASVGTATPVAGQWLIDAAAWEEPALVLSEKHFRAPFTVTIGVGNSDAFNAVKGKFANPAKLWNADDFPAIVSSLYEIEDGGDGTGLGREFKDVNLEFTDSAAMAQRLCRIDLRKARQPISFTAQVKLIGLRLRAGNTVAIDNAMLGWSAKPFKVQKVSMVLGFAPGGGSQPGIVGVDLDLRETAAAIYDWDPALDEQPHDPAPNTTLPDIFNPLPVAHVDVEEQLYVTRDGTGVKTSAVLSWPASADAFVDRYRPQYRLVGDDWTIRPDVAAQSVTIEDLSPGQWEFGVAAVNHSGIASAVESKVVNITGLLALPADVANFHVTPLGGSAILHFDPTVDLDVQIGGRLVVKHSPATSGATWDAAVSIGRAIPGSATSAAIPLKAGTYLARWEDSSGQQSADVASWVTKQANAVAYTNLAGLTEDSTFTGTKTHCTVVSSKLKLDSGVDSGTYSFHANVDLGAVTLCRITSLVDAQILATTDYWDSDEICDSTDYWDSTVTGNEADAWVEMSQTDDNPSGSPTWGPWQRVDAMEAAARGLRFRAQLTRARDDYSIELAGLAVSVDGVA